MASIQCGTFGPTTKVEVNKSYIHVKLTDSAFKAIDEYIKSKGKITGTPSVSFHGNEGELSIPKCGNGNTMFNFVMQEANQQGSYESVKQFGANTLESLGPMMAKMKLAAKQKDSFQMTRDRIAADKENNHKKQAKELKPLNQNPNNSFGRKRCNPVTVTGSKRNLPPKSITAKESFLPPKSIPAKESLVFASDNSFGRKRCAPVTVTSSKRILPSKSIPAKEVLVSSSSNDSYSKISHNSTNSTNLQHTHPTIIRIQHLLEGL